MRGIGGFLATAASGNKKAGKISKVVDRHFAGTTQFYAGYVNTASRHIHMSSSGEHLYMGIGNGIFYRIVITGNRYDIGSASYNQYTSTYNSLGHGCRGFIVTPNEDKLITVNDTNDTIVGYPMSTPGDLSTIDTSSAETLSCATSDAADLCFGNNGLKLYYCDVLDHYAYEYTLSTAYDVSTATYVQKSNQRLDYTSTVYARSPIGIDITADGSAFYVLGQYGDDRIGLVPMTTAFDISTITTTGRTIDYGARSFDYGLQIVPDGNEQSLLVFDPDFAFQHSLREDGSTSYVFSDQYYFKYQTNERLDYTDSNWGRSPIGIFLHPDGDYIFVLSQYGDDDISRVPMSTKFDPKTITTTGRQIFTVGALSLLHGGLWFSNDGIKVFYMDNDRVYQRSMSTPWDLYTVSSATSVSLSSYAATFDFFITFSWDGYYMLTSEGGGVLNKFTLSTPWDPNTIQSEQSVDYDPYISTAVQPSGYTATGKQYNRAQWNSDGTKIYILVRNGGNDNSQGLYEFDLGTAYDLTTPTFVSRMGTGGGADVWADFHINSDGTHLAFCDVSSHYGAIVPLPRTKAD